MDVSIKINGTKVIELNPETPIEHEYLPLIKDSEQYQVTREPNSNKLIFKQPTWQRKKKTTEHRTIDR